MKKTQPAVEVERRRAELEEKRRWHFAEIEDAEATIRRHRWNIVDIQKQLDALQAEAV